jgi:poly-beta-1,6-N-acetyl-D-glucosamine synthase
MQNHATSQALANSAGGQRRNLRYALVTPARNEEAYIEETIRSVIRQTVLPVRWVIVSDGSSDRTDEIIKTYAVQFPWISYLRMPERQVRDFAGKVHAFNAGYSTIADADYDVIGNLDADISFDEDYFCFLLQKFSEDPHLGVGGTPFREGSFQYDYRFTSVEHVSGACQLFRRECFESIGGYTPIRDGGIDLVAVTTARMRGWTTRSFPDKVCMHHRQMGTGKSKILMSRFRFGKQDFYLGSHPLWETFRSMYQMSNKPYILAGACLLAGYFWAYLGGEEKRVSEELAQFRRKEQMKRLKEFFKSIVGKPSATGTTDRTS